ncbi:condensation domain-containing protein [Streptomyces sp. NPDC002536]
MLMTTLSEYGVRPGLLREWTLDEEPFRAAARPGSAEWVGPPSYNQEWHLKFASRLAERGSGIPLWMGFAFELPGPLDVEAFREALRTWTGQHETLRSGFRMSGAKPELFTVCSDAVSVQDVVLGEFTGDDDISGCLQKRIDEATDAFRWPSHVVETVERADSTTVIVALDHAHTDGFSVMTAVAEWQRLYAACVEGRSAELPAVRSYVDFGAAERAAAQRIDAGHPAVGHWSRFIAAGDDRLLRFPLDLGVAEGELLPHAKLDVRLLDASEAQAVEAVCHDAGGGFLTGLLAAFAMVTHSITGDPVYRTVMPVHTRSRPEQQHSMGWYVGVAPVEVGLGAAEGFHDVVRAAHRSARTTLRHGRVPIARIAELLGTEAEWERRMPEVFPFVSFIDTRVIPGVRQWPEWNARTVARLRTRGSKVNFWLHRTHDGVLLTARYPGTGTAEVSVADFVGRVQGVLRSAAGRGTAVEARCQE